MKERVNITPDLELCRTTSRKYEVQFKKKAIANYLYRENNVSLQLIAKFMGMKHHSSIMNHKQDHTYWYGTFKDYTKYYDSLKKTNLEDIFKEFYKNYKETRKMETVYIAGKVSGLDYQVARKNFQHYEDIFDNLGYNVVNPMKIVGEHTDWKQAMKICLKHLLDCDRIFLMENWRSSKGAILEAKVAENCNITRLYISKITGKKPIFTEFDVNNEDFEQN